MARPIITIDNIGKKYRITHSQESRSNYVALRDVLSDTAKNITGAIMHPFKKKGRGQPAAEDFWALRNISFDINEGDRIGIIGRNGAGKSTLLKILSRITEPTEGRITMRGRVASLLEVGTGFHPELTGRENIYLNGAILGMSRREIDRKFDEIVDFAGVARFLDTPVKRFSSGMYVRLSFAVAAHLESEILLIDEVLAVGDAEFQKKCLGKMDDVAKNNGKTVLFVSHNMGAVSALCNKAIILENGQLAHSGETQECISVYMERMEISKNSPDLRSVKRMQGLSGEAKIISFSMHNVGSDAQIIDSDKSCRAELIFEVLEDNFSVGGEIIISDGMQKLLLFNSNIRNGITPVFKKGTYKLVCYTDPLSLYSGTYYVTLSLLRSGVPLVDYIENAVEIEVILPQRNGSAHEYKKIVGSTNIYCEHRWVAE